MEEDKKEQVKLQALQAYTAKRELIIKEQRDGCIAYLCNLISGRADLGHLGGLLGPVVYADQNPMLIEEKKVIGDFYMGRLQAHLKLKGTAE